MSRTLRHSHSNTHIHTWMVSSIKHFFLSALSSSTGAAEAVRCLAEGHVDSVIWRREHSSFLLPLPDL